MFVPAIAQQPDSPSNVSVSIDTVTRNLVVWTDESSVSGETYNIYFSDSPIVDVSAVGVVKAGRNVAEGVESFLHVLYTAQTSGPISYYYAVTSVSSSDEENVAVSGGVNATTSATENDAIATGMIALISTPVVLDGDISEFTSQTIPFVMDTTNSWVGGEVTDDTDLSGKCYLMVDADNLYFAANVTDEALVQNFTGFGTWNGDSYELHIGLYPLPGVLDHNQRFKRGPEPDYQFRLSINEETWLHVRWPGLADSGSPNHVVSYVDLVIAPRQGGYFMEAVIPLADLIADPFMQSHPGGADSLFVPEVGMVLPVDFTLNDADVDVYEGHEYFFWEGPSIPRPFESPQVWSQAIIALPQTLTVAVRSEDGRSSLPDNFTLSASFPNPFKTSSSASGFATAARSTGRTSIRYTLSQAENISLKIYNILGREVATLVQGRVPAGQHSVSWDGRNRFQNIVPTGMYFYRLQVGGSVKTRKLLLLK